MATAKTMSAKLQEAAPYNLFYNKLESLTELQSNLITFQDMLCPSLGKLEASLQITGKVDVVWLKKQYEEQGLGDKPLLILCNKEKFAEERTSDLSNVTIHHVESAVLDKFSSHHSKIGIYKYADKSLRVVVSTANLYKYQFDNHSHGFWISPLCPYSKHGTGESPTEFKSSLLTYLEFYKVDYLNEWIDAIKCVDFSEIKVFLITTVPGSFPNSLRNCHFLQMEHWLSRFAAIDDDDNQWPVVVQVSSLGFFGTSASEWLTSTFLKRVNIQKKATTIQIVFPSVENVKHCYLVSSEENKDFRYDTKIQTKQRWILDYLYQWKADLIGRSKILPHTKIYCQVSPSGNKMAWFLLSSSNLSKGPWGRDDFRRGWKKTYARNFEAGVLFLPKLFYEEYFTIKTSNDESVDEKTFPLVFDLPLKKYEKGDIPSTSTNFE